RARMAPNEAGGAAMTIRSVIYNKVLKFHRIQFVAIAPVAVAVVLPGWMLGRHYAPLGVSASFGVFMLALLGRRFALDYYQWCGAPCPRCGVAWGEVALSAARWTRMGALSIDPRIKYCPFCGADVDAELTKLPMEGEANHSGATGLPATPDEHRV